MQIVLHIGADKTGTTAYQGFLFRNSELLKQQGVFVIQTGITPFGHWPILKNLDGELWAQFDQEIRELASNPACKVAVFSWEGVHNMPPDKLNQIRLHFGDCDFRILYAIREQAELESSGILQRIKQSNFNNSLANIDNILDQAFSWPVRDPVKALERLGGAFGRSNIRLRTYSRQVLDDLLADTGVVLNDTFNMEFESNPSFTYEAALAFEEVAKPIDHAGKRSAMRDAVLNEVDRLKGNKKVFLTKSVDYIRGLFIESNRQVAKEWFDRDELFPLKDIARTTPPDRELVEQYKQIAKSAL